MRANLALKTQYLIICCLFTLVDSHFTIARRRLAMWVSKEIVKARDHVIASTRRILTSVTSVLSRGTVLDLFNFIVALLEPLTVSLLTY